MHRNGLCIESEYKSEMLVSDDRWDAPCELQQEFYALGLMCHIPVEFPTVVHNYYLIMVI